VRVLKLGGGIITKRDAFLAYDQANVQRLGAVLRTCTEPLVITHGLGSFGRAYLPCYQGGTLPAVQGALARSLQQRLRELHDLVAADLFAAGVMVRSFDGESLFALQDRKVVKAALELVEYYVLQGYVPLLHGGTVWDDAGRYAILSSDQIAEQVVEWFGARRLVWATDVDGVLRAGDHEVMDILDEGNLQQMWRQDYDQTDATGGMTSKVMASLRLARKGCTSIVVNGSHPERVARAVSGAPVRGTVVPAH
jgi:isopentenyl phosphate kinase